MKMACNIFVFLIRFQRCWILHIFFSHSIVREANIHIPQFVIHQDENGHRFIIVKLCFRSDCIIFGLLVNLMIITITNIHNWTLIAFYRWGGNKLAVHFHFKSVGFPNDVLSEQWNVAQNDIILLSILFLSLLFFFFHIMIHCRWVVVATMRGIDKYAQTKWLIYSILLYDFHSPFDEVKKSIVFAFVEYLLCSAKVKVYWWHPGRTKNNVTEKIRPKNNNKIENKIV